MTTLLDTLRAIVGPTHVITEGDLTAWEQDWRRRVRGKALAVVRPANTQEVAAVVKACAAVGTAIVPQGGNTGLAVGSIPDDSGTQVVLSLQRLNADIENAHGAALDLYAAQLQRGVDDARELGRVLRVGRVARLLQALREP
eukprot:gene45078-60183_t